MSVRTGGVTVVVYLNSSAALPRAGPVEGLPQQDVGVTLTETSVRQIEACVELDVVGGKVRRATLESLGLAIAAREFKEVAVVLFGWYVVNRQLRLSARRKLRSTHAKFETTLIPRARFWGSAVASVPSRGASPYQKKRRAPSLVVHGSFSVSQALRERPSCLSVCLHRSFPSP